MEPERVRQLLPVAFQDAVGDEVLDDLLAVMADMQGPVEQVLDTLDTYVDPRRCPPRFVPYLASWVGLGWLVGEPQPAAGFPTGLGRLRELVAQAAPLASLRGTGPGLQRFLELLLGTTDVVIAAPAGRPFHVTVTVPGAARPHGELIARVVHELKPAHLEVDVTFEPGPSPEGEAA